jgi:hypothetical protein
MKLPAWWSMWSGRPGAPWVNPEVLGFTRARAHAKGPQRRKPCVLSDTSQQKANFVSIEQWKTTSCLPSKPCVGWFLDFVITSWSEFLKIFTFKALSQGVSLGSPYFGNDLNLGLYPTLKRTISLKFEAQGPKVPHQTWKYHMLEILEFSSHATVHTTTT